MPWNITGIRLSPLGANTWTIAFTDRLKGEPHNWLGTMSLHPIMWQGTYYPTAEHLFQCLRLPVGCLHEAKVILAYRNPKKARKYAKAQRYKFVVEPMSDFDVDNMRLVLTLKTEQYPELREKLVATGDDLLVKDCTHRLSRTNLFWGAALIAQGTDNEEWVGKNMLGKTWMKVRESLKK